MAHTTGLTGPPQPPPKVVRQELAPKGGYAPINVARNVPRSITTGGASILVGTAVLMSYGFYRLGTFNVKRRELRQEKKRIRLAIVPFLQAEEDARFVLKREEYNKWEAELMKDFPDWKVGENVYKTRTFVKPIGNEPPYSYS